MEKPNPKEKILGQPIFNVYLLLFRCASSKTSFLLLPEVEDPK